MRVCMRVAIWLEVDVGEDGGSESLEEGLGGECAEVLTVEPLELW